MSSTSSTNVTVLHLSNDVTLITTITGSNDHRYLVTRPMSMIRQTIPETSASTTHFLPLEGLSDPVSVFSKFVMMSAPASPSLAKEYRAFVALLEASEKETT